MEDVIKLEPIFFEKIWGGEKLSKIYSYDTKEYGLGEIWGISAHKEGINVIKDGEFKGKRLDEIWNENKELFGNPYDDEFPIQMRLIDAKEKLSVQVHPYDEYAKKNDNDNGKVEAWYVMDCDETSKIVYGQFAENKEVIKKSLKEKNIENYLNEIPVKIGDFIYVPTGVVHAIGENNLFIEVSQSSNTTYRFYDYNRKDKYGIERELHIEKSLDVVQFEEQCPKLDIEIEYHKNAVEKTFIDNNFFTIKNINTVNDTSIKKKNAYYICYVISGLGVINEIEVKNGEFFIITNEKDIIDIKGKLDILIAYKKI